MIPKSVRRERIVGNAEGARIPIAEEVAGIDRLSVVDPGALIGYAAATLGLPLAHPGDARRRSRIFDS